MVNQPPTVMELRLTFALSNCEFQNLDSGSEEIPVPMDRQSSTSSSFKSKDQRERYWNTVLCKDGSTTTPSISGEDLSANVSLPAQSDKSRHTLSQQTPVQADTARRGTTASNSLGPHRIEDVYAQRVDPSHVVSASRPAICDKCGASFKRRYDFSQHMLAVHEKARPFPCALCGQTFSHKGTVSKHVRTVHLRKRPFTCDHCQQGFSDRGNFNKHRQRSLICRLAGSAVNKSNR